MRVEAVVRAYIASAAEVLALQRPARKIIPRLLFCIACELLTVRLLPPEVGEALAYRGWTRLSGAFLSTITKYNTDVMQAASRMLVKRHPSDVLALSIQ